MAKALALSEGSKQFAKFCVIGASSTLLDIFISRKLIDVFGMYWLYANTLSFVVSVTNGYIWNSLWTFRGLGADGRHTQYLKFVAVNLVGLVLNILIFGLVVLLLMGHLRGNPPKPIWYAAKLTATLLVAAWNFLANKRWTFAEARA